jgi:hypothetical protein
MTNAVNICLDFTKYSSRRSLALHSPHRSEACARSEHGSSDHIQKDIDKMSEEYTKRLWVSNGPPAGAA